MPLTKVTITGADDKTGINEMLELSMEFPFVEWGILISKMRTNTRRFPSQIWMNDLFRASCKFAMTSGQKMQLSLHLCGGWTRDLLTGSLNWDDLLPLVSACQRIQINTHGEPHVVLDYVENLRMQPKKQYIFQWEPANKNLVFAPAFYKLDCAILFDTSGGAGILPKTWPAPILDIPCGYAGGLGPDNVLEQVNKLEILFPDYSYWIDMERRVRSADDSHLLMDSVRSVLKQCKPFVKESHERNSESGNPSRQTGQGPGKQDSR